MEATSFETLEILLNVAPEASSGEPAALLQSLMMRLFTHVLATLASFIEAHTFAGRERFKVVSREFQAHRFSTVQLCVASPKSECTCTNPGPGPCSARL